MKFKNIKKGKDTHYKSRKEKKGSQNSHFSGHIVLKSPGQKSAGVEKKVKKRLFPKFHRFITESHVVRLRWQKRGFWLQAISILAFLGFIIVCAHIYDYYLLSRQLQKERLTYKEKLIQWDQLIEEYPGFRDGYLQAAMIYYQLGDKNKAKIYLAHALTIDPNFTPSRRFALLLGIGD